MDNKIRMKTKGDNNEKYGLFQFSPRFIHPSLLHFSETKKRIIHWFNKMSDSFKYIDIKDEYKFKMTLSDIKNIQNYIYENEEQIKKQMNLQYEAVPFPKEIQEDILNDKNSKRFCIKRNSILLLLI